MSASLSIGIEGHGSASVVLAITKAAFASTSAYAHPSSALNEKLDGLRASGDEFLVARSQGRAIAAARLRMKAPALEFTRLAVLPALQGRGVGEAMLDHIEGLARERAMHEVRCAARSSMPDNRPFYLRRGYEVLGYEHVYGVPNLRTRLRLVLS